MAMGVLQDHASGSSRTNRRSHSINLSLQKVWIVHITIIVDVNDSMSLRSSDEIVNPTNSTQKDACLKAAALYDMERRLPG